MLFAVQKELRKYQLPSNIHKSFKKSQKFRCQKTSKLSNLDNSSISYGLLKGTDIFIALPRKQIVNPDFGSCIIKDPNNCIYKGGRLH